MYTAIILIGIALAAVLIARGLKNHTRSSTVAGGAIAALTALFFWFLGFWGEYLWFESISFGDRFITELLARTVMAAAGAFVAWLLVFLLSRGGSKDNKLFNGGVQAFAFLWGAGWGYANWDTALRWQHRVSMDVAEPVLGHDVGFYLFTLPMLDAIHEFLLILLFLALATAALNRYFGFNGDTLQFEPGGRRDANDGPLYRNGGLIFFVVAFGFILERYFLMYSHHGAVSGPGWTDIHIRFPAYLVMAVASVAAGVAIMLPQTRRLFARSTREIELPEFVLPVVTMGTIAVSVFLLWFAGLVVLPGLFQWLRVEPNEITFEKPYIARNIEFTRRAFGLHRVEEREFPAGETFTPQMVDANPQVFNNIRLWDWRALDDVYKQFQEIRLYYEFNDVDIDRYTIDGEYREVMVSARELEQNNLPEQSRTFVNRRFKYTHGYGVTMTMVNEFTPDGLPHLLIKDIPPKSEFASLEIDRPALYYGALTRSHVLVNTSEEEFDYPSGEENMYTRYDGTGGVQLSNIWRKFLFGWKFDGTRLFFSGYPTSESRILFHREIHDRVKSLAPFLTFDDDPYVVVNDGKLYWILDGYTTSEFFPYSEPFNAREVISFQDNSNRQMISSHLGRELDGVNYIRNSVKAVIDAYNGTVDFYVFEEDDPVIRVWERIYDGMFKPRSEMPDDLEKHVRYPADMLLVQGLQYAKYHMTDPAVFYNQEDLWVRATEKYYDRVQPVEPYYVIWEEPDSDEPEFVIMLPFTPKNRQVLIGWIAGMCDNDNYGRFLAYKFPKEKRVLGTQQVETKIDQDSFLSGQLSLWDQRGSNVIRGNVLAIPVEETLIYVEPIYLQAETAAYPELRLVAVMHGDNLSYAETFEDALAGLFGEGGSRRQVRQQTPAGGAGESSVSTLIEQANGAFEDYLQLLGNRRYEDAGRALNRLEQALEDLVRQNGQSTGTDSTPDN